MNRQIAMDWADALESGKYPQGMWALHSDDEFCAIGVLAHLAWEAGIIEREAYETRYHTGFSYDGEKFAPSPKVMEWAELQHGTDIQVPSTGKSIMGLNDHGDESFAYIANVIRKHWSEM
jgi:hypothetical protein